MTTIDGRSVYFDPETNVELISAKEADPLVEEQLIELLARLLDDE